MWVNTSEIGLFKIVQETSIAANTRRIEAVTSLEAYKYMSTYEEELRETARFLKIPPLDVCERVVKMQKQLDEYERVAKRNKKIAAEGSFADYIKAAVDADGYKLVIVNMGEGGSVQDMREGWDIVKQRAQGKPFALVVFAISADKGTPIMLAAGNDAAVAAGFNANDVIKQRRARSSAAVAAASRPWRRQAARTPRASTLPSPRPKRFSARRACAS